MSRRTAAVLILALWVGALGWLTERHFLGRGGERGQPRWPVPPGSAFHIVRLGDRQIGLASQTVDTLGDGLRVVQLVTLDLPTTVPDQRRRTSVRLEALYTRGLQLREWRSLELTEHGRSAGHGTVYGDSLLLLVTTSEGEPPETLRVRLRRPVVLPGTIPLVAASRGLPRPGSRLNLEVFDPLDRELRLERLVVAAESVFSVPDSAAWDPSLGRWVVAHTDTVRAWRLDAEEHGLPVSRWVDGSGMIVLTRYPLGAELQRSAFELVNTNFRRRPVPTWDTTAEAPAYFGAPLPPRPRRELAVVSHLAPEDTLPETVPALSGGWQTRAGDTLVVARPGAAAGDSTPAEATVWSLADPDSVLRTAAERIVRREPQPEARALALQAWVRRHITVRDGPFAAAAIRTFTTRQGTPEARVLLLVALARGAGMPAREVWGLVLSAGRWHLRPWAEIWTDTWLPLDPGMRGEDAGRVRLATGGQARLLDLALRAGRLRLQPIEDTR